ncbi:flavin reductase family protein [Paramuribaculum intestinale]|uniref:flavin reductase family protein n=1 Tax=Paramuribaculum intestinale TaxID=2094151 RepID=UPI0025A99000|nr:flavin reductase family protein [Paramuribaculum intestinale]
MKQIWKPGTMIYPLPAVLVSCGDMERSNLITVAWTGTICTNPAMCYISVRPERHSYPIIASTMEFTINLTTESMAHAIDLCGVKSGRDIDKWEVTGLTKGKGVNVSCPYIVESPLSIECRVKEIMHLGSHDMMIAEVLGVLADDSLLDPSTDAFDLGQAGLINYSHGHYYRQGEEIGRFGWTVKKK